MSQLNAKSQLEIGCVNKPLKTVSEFTPKMLYEVWIHKTVLNMLLKSS
jgi:hypothetical protein